MKVVGAPVVGQFSGGVAPVLRLLNEECHSFGHPATKQGTLLLLYDLAGTQVGVEEVP